MKTSLLAGFLITVLFASSQVNHVEMIKEIYSNWENSSNKCETFYYADSIDTYSIEIVKEQFIVELPFYKYSINNDTANAERIRFDAKERKYILEQLGKLNSVLWPDSILPKSRVVPFAKIDSIQQSISDRKLDPLLRLCYAVHIFSNPIFLRKSTICLFYAGTTTFATKDGEFWIYRKEGEHWKRYTPIYGG